jgi:thiol-disulfide isomerase/thioredoxin
VIGPVASASGTLKDLEGKPVGDRELTYGIRIFQGEPLRSPFSDSFGGTTKTDTQGRFSLVGLVPGEAYQLNVKIDDHSSRTVTEVIPQDAQPLALGELSADPNPTKPYVPPTPAERAAQGFAAKRDMPLGDRLDNLLAEARREYTQPLLLFGKADDPACIELYRLLEHSDALSDEEKAKGDFVSPDELRWEFELAALDIDLPEIREQATKMKIELAAGVPVLAVLDQQGSLVTTLPLELKGKKLDSRSIGGWMAEHKLPTRDAQQMLDEALAKAQQEDKRVFFILSASWCGPCRMLARFLAPHKSELEKHFVFVKLDVSRDEHADELKARFKESASGGVPWYCILNAEDAQVLCTSNVPGGNPRSGNSNMGFPTLPKEVEHFVGMLKTTAPRLAEEKLAEYKAELLKKK